MLRWLLWAILGATSSLAHAGTSSGTLGVAATLGAECQLTVQSMSFSSISALLNVNQDNVSTLNVRCTPGTSFSLALGTGLGPSASTTVRQLQTSDGSMLNYSLSMDSAHSSNWGNTIGSDTFTGIGTGHVQVIPIYSRIASGQKTITGTYTDTVLATVSY